MNREIEFRGKRVDGKGWAYGSPIIIKRKGGDMAYILPPLSMLPGISLPTNHFTAAIPSTVSQYAEEKDVNEQKMYGGDRVAFTIFDCFDHDIQHEGVIKFNDGEWQVWQSEDNEFYGSDGMPGLHWICQQDDEIKVIGSIHDTEEQ